MIALNPLALAVAAVAAFILSSTWYVVFAAQRAADSTATNAARGSRPSAWMIGTELLRSLTVAVVLAVLADLLALDDVPEALALAVGLWIGFPLVLLSGSVLWENVPARLAAVHAGDWLVKLILIALIVCLWQ